MKKILSLFCLILLAGIAFSQQLNNFPNPSIRFDASRSNQAVLSPVLVNQNPAVIPTRAIGDQHSIWVNFPYELCQSLLEDWSQTTSFQIMCPDSTVLVRWLTTIPTPTPHYGFTYTKTRWASVGLTLNPVSTYLNFDNLWSDTPYSIDSIDIEYIYHRYSAPGIIDTLIIQLIQPDNLAPYTWKANKKPAYAVPHYNRGQNIASMAAITKRFPLGPGDTTSYSTFSMPVSGFTVSKGGPCAMVWTFAPGQKNIHGDTIPLAKWDSVQGVANPVNLFRWPLFSENSATELDEYNNGDIINFEQRYHDINTSFPSVYLPGGIFVNGNGPIALFPIAHFKVTYTETTQSIEHTALFDDIKVSLFPNPVRVNSSFTVHVNMQKSRLVNIALYDMIGHKVSTISDGLLTTGDHSITASTANLSAGVYFCKVRSGNSFNSFKVSVR